MPELIDYTEQVTKQQRVTDICWRAREILATHMHMAADLEDEEEHCFANDSDITLHETEHAPLNDNWSGLLTNCPFIDLSTDRPIRLSQPGFVALRKDHYEDQEDSEQIIFQLKSPGSEAVIYKGWAINSRNIIWPGHTRQLNRVARMLEKMSLGLREHAECHEGMLMETYHANVPQIPIGESVEQMLRDSS